MKNSPAMGTKRQSWPRMERELYDAVGVGVANLAVRLDDAEGFVARASRANDKLPYTTRRVGHSVRRLRANLS